MLRQPIYFFLSSPLLSLLERFEEAFRKKKSFFLGEEEFYPLQIKILPKPTLDKVPLKIQTISPICIAKRKKKKWIFVSPKEEKFSQEIQSLLEKRLSLLGEESKVEFTLKPLDLQKHKIYLSKWEIEGYVGYFSLYIREDLLLKIYDINWGSFANWGLGMIKITS